MAAVIVNGLGLDLDGAVAATSLRWPGLFHVGGQHGDDLAAAIDADIMPR